MAKIVAIRIRGDIDLDPKLRDTLASLNLKKKFSCVILEDKPEVIGMLKKAQPRISYGYINDETLAELIKKRLKIKNEIAEKELDKFIRDFIDGKTDFKKIGANFIFNLHPPRGGFKKSTKLIYPRGVLGKNEKINELIVRML